MASQHRWSRHSCDPRGHLIIEGWPHDTWSIMPYQWCLWLGSDKQCKQSGEWTDCQNDMADQEERADGNFSVLWWQMWKTRLHKQQMTDGTSCCWVRERTAHVCLIPHLLQRTEQAKWVASSMSLGKDLWAKSEWFAWKIAHKLFSSWKKFGKKINVDACRLRLNVCFVCCVDLWCRFLFYVANPCWIVCLLLCTMQWFLQSLPTNFEKWEEPFELLDAMSKSSLTCCIWVAVATAIANTLLLHADNLISSPTTGQLFCHHRDWPLHEHLSLNLHSSSATQMQIPFESGALMECQAMTSDDPLL